MASWRARLVLASHLCNISVVCLANVRTRVQNISHWYLQLQKHLEERLIYQFKGHNLFWYYATQWKISGAPDIILHFAYYIIKCVSFLRFNVYVYMDVSTITTLCTSFSFADARNVYLATPKARCCILNEHATRPKYYSNRDHRSDCFYYSPTTMTTAATAIRRTFEIWNGWFCVCVCEIAFIFSWAHSNVHTIGTFEYIHILCWVSFKITFLLFGLIFAMYFLILLTTLTYILNLFFNQHKIWLTINYCLLVPTEKSVWPREKKQYNH